MVMNARVAIVLVAAVVAAADQRPPYSYDSPRGSLEYSTESKEAQYNYNYVIKNDYSGNDFGHQEARDGDNTKGSYYVQLPDGRLQTVTYFVDGDRGYVAEVSYQGEARYPDSSEVRSYGTPPRPQYGLPESEESVEASAYSLPVSLYNTPTSYTTPRPHTTPRASYTTPRLSYNAPRAILLYTQTILHYTQSILHYTKAQHNTQTILH
ncbi:cuticle protein 8-like [Procambarus clarkii]|uniref:cuticle protein 8-like n=1 Tax=Procambarus clarkii TaxID=6728 RepID=UPI0037435405